MADAKVKDPTKVVTGQNCRFSYAQLFEPKAMEEGGKLKYSVAILIPKSDKETVEKIKAGIAAAEAKAMAEGGVFEGKKPKDYKYPVLRDGDGEDSEGDPLPEEYHGHWYVNAKSDKKPAIVGTEKDEKGNWKEITDPSVVYSGCYGRAIFNIFPYKHPTGGKGLAAGLQAVQKIRDGQPLGGSSVDVNEDFEDLEMVDDDLLN